MTVIALAVAGLCAGAVNAVVGAGTLIVFPVLVALGYAPVVAIVTTSIGLLPGSITAATGYRSHLRGVGDYTARLAGVAAMGALIGSTLLLTLDPTAFRYVVPFLVLLACALVIAEPRLTKLLRRNNPRAPSWRQLAPIFVLTGIYGGYFGGAQGVILLSVLSISLPCGLQQLNAVKNVLAATGNAVAAVLFVIFGNAAWQTVGVIAAGSTIGGVAGAYLGVRIPPSVLRLLVVTVGLAAAIRMLLP